MDVRSRSFFVYYLHEDIHWERWVSFQHVAPVKTFSYFTTDENFKAGQNVEFLDENGKWTKCIITITLAEQNRVEVKYVSSTASPLSVHSPHVHSESK